MTKGQRVLVAFQGGGARGIAHIGALQALEEWTLASDSQLDVELRPEIAGVAGTSAGAIIAALVAARYSSKDIFDANEKQHLLMRVAQGAFAAPKNLFSRRGWSRIARVRRLATWYHKYPKVLTSLAQAALGLLVVWWISPYGGLEWRLKLCFALLGMLIFLVVRRYLQGMAGLADVRSVVDEVMASAQLPGKLSGQAEITFAQLAEAGGLPLKIVSTNITSRTMEVFSSVHTPDVVIADAVCASICLPLVFSPYRLRLPHTSSESRFLDGGMLSNLPLWSFDEERAADPNVWTLGFSLTRAASSSQAKKAGHWIGAAIDTIISGPSQIHARAMPGLMIIPTPTSLQLLDFDASFESFANDIATAKESCLGAMVDAAAEPLVKEHLVRLAATLAKHFLELQARLPGSGSIPIGEDELAFRLAIAIQRPSNPSILYPRFLTGYEGGALEARSKPLPGAEWVNGQWVLGLPLAHIPEDDPVSSDGETWLIADSCWVMGFELPSGKEVGDGKLAPVLLVESATLTQERLVTTLGAEAEFPDLVEVIAQVVEKVDQELELGKRAMRTQLWK